MKYGAFDYIVNGEGAFLRAEKTVFNIYRYHKMAGDASRYKKLMIFFGVGMLIMIAVVVILQTKGLIRSSPSWYGKFVSIRLP
ncbi:MAG: hypothetical protein IPN36_04380 [Bacteroidetes bacterium]|nr:hypothetical protein [Bacteroidota bacterium]